MGFCLFWEGGNVWVVFSGGVAAFGCFEGGAGQGAGELPPSPGAMLGPHSPALPPPRKLGGNRKQRSRLRPTPSRCRAQGVAAAVPPEEASGLRGEARQRGGRRTPPASPRESGAGWGSPPRRRTLAGRSGSPLASLPGRQTGSPQRAGAQAQGPHQGQLPQPAGLGPLPPGREGEFGERGGSAAASPTPPARPAAPSLDRDFGGSGAKLRFLAGSANRRFPAPARLCPAARTPGCVPTGDRSRASLRPVTSAQQSDGKTLSAAPRVGWGSPKPVGHPRGEVFISPLSFPTIATGIPGPNPGQSHRVHPVHAPEKPHAPAGHRRPQEAERPPGAAR